MSKSQLASLAPAVVMTAAGVAALVAIGLEWVAEQFEKRLCDD